MPLYEYSCRKCGTKLEVRQKFSDAPLETHEGCGGQLERLVSASAIHFKGSGWYITDYARKSGSSPKTASDAKGPAKETPAPAKAETTTKTDSTPAKKSAE